MPEPFGFSVSPGPADLSIAHARMLKRVTSLCFVVLIVSILAFLFSCYNLANIFGGSIYSNASDTINRLKYITKTVYQLSLLLTFLCMFAYGGRRRFQFFMLTSVIYLACMEFYNCLVISYYNIFDIYLIAEYFECILIIALAPLLILRSPEKSVSRLIRVSGKILCVLLMIAPLPDCIRAVATYWNYFISYADFNFIAFGIYYILTYFTQFVLYFLLFRSFEKDFPRLLLMQRTVVKKTKTYLRTDTEPVRILAEIEEPPDISQAGASDNPPVHH